MDNKLKENIIKILEYFDKGLSDVESGSGEEQPMHKEIRSTLKRLYKSHIMSKKIKNKVTKKFKKGTVLHLDTIYNEQGLFGGNWWKFENDNPFGERVVITRDIHFDIIEYETK